MRFFSFLSESALQEQIGPVDCKAKGFSKHCNESGIFLLKLLLPFSLQIMVLQQIHICKGQYNM